MVLEERLGRGNIDHVLIGNVGMFELSSMVYFLLSAFCKGCLSLLILLDLSLMAAVRVPF